MVMLTKKCEDLQRLKFGQLVDLEKLDEFAVHENLVALKEKIVQLEVVQTTELHAIKNEIKQLKMKHLHEIERNTQLLSDLAVENQKHYNLEKELNKQASEKKRLIQSGNEALVEQQRADELKERNQLMQLVKLQAQEIEGLKMEIQLLSSKAQSIHR